MGGVGAGSQRQAAVLIFEKDCVLMLNLRILIPFSHATPWFRCLNFYIMGKGTNSHNVHNLTPIDLSNISRQFMNITE